MVGSKFPDYRYVATLLRCAPEQLREVPPETYKVWREMHPVCGHRSDWWSQGSDWWSQNSARSSADTSQERSSAPTEQLSSENMLVGMMSTVVENRQGAVSRAASYRCMYKCMMYVYVCQLINYHISTNMHSLIIINRRSFARWNVSRRSLARWSLVRRSLSS